MSITVIHGENIPQIEIRYKELVSEYKKNGFIIDKFNQEIKKTLPEFISGVDLFEEKKLYVIDNYSEVTPVELEKTIKQIDKSQDLLFVFDKKIGKTILDKFPSTSRVEEIKLSENVFMFLDTLYPGNSENSILLLHRLVDNGNPSEFILALMARHLKDVYLLKIHELNGKESWKIAKLSKPARMFSEKQITKLISELADADIKSKRSEGSLIDSLDHVIAVNLE